MLTTVFKDKIPKGLSYPFPLEFLKRALHGTAAPQVALYFVHGSHWILGKHNLSQEHLHEPRPLLAVGKTRPMLRNNNQKVTAEVEGYDWHFLLWAMPSEIRHDLQKQFQDIAQQPLAQWFLNRKPRSNHAKIWWFPATQHLTMDFPDKA